MTVVIEMPSVYGRKELRAPFPFFGGKSRAAPLIWSRFGDAANYVEPFAGSLAVLLARPTAPRIETVNDKDAHIANFWRATANDPEAVARYADWPVNEVDLTARHVWLRAQDEFRRRMFADPDYFDVKVAGWWVWGISQWIGGGWCVPEDTRRTRARHARKRPQAAGMHAGKGVHCAGNLPGSWRPHVTGDSAGGGVRGLLASSGKRSTARRPDVCGEQGGRGTHSRRKESIYDRLALLSERLRNVRVLCGDFRRVLTPVVVRSTSVTAVLLDPPYDHDMRDTGLYNEDDRTLSGAAREWAIEHGDDPGLRIALCGLQGEHEMPSGWRKDAWLGHGGMSRGRSKASNRTEERIWFSPHCLDGNGPLFAEPAR